MAQTYKSGETVPQFGNGQSLGTEEAMIKHIARTLAVSTALPALLLVGATQTTASAQSTATPTSTTDAAAPTNQDQDHRDWGWLGLLGLGGLAGLVRRRPDTTYTPDVRTRDNR